MRIVSFRRGGANVYGVLQGEDLVEADEQLLKKYPDVKALLEAGALYELAVNTAGRRPTARLADVQLAPPIANPGKIFCVGLNYKTHVAETKRPDAEFPAIFTRFADTLIGHNAPLQLPGKVTQKFDYEGELAVVIGIPGRDIRPEDAFKHIAAYAPFNDATVRDWQRHTHQWTPGKNFPGTGAFGPALVTSDEVPDVTKLSLTTRLNGDVVQNASLADLIFSIPTVIAYLSTFTELRPGDVIATGTPGGVGDRREPPRYLQPGEVVEVEISGIGTLRNAVEAV